MLRNKTQVWTWLMFLHCISAALKRKKEKKRFLSETKEQQTEQKHSRGCWRHEGYCSHFVTFLIFLSQLNYVQVFSILHRAAVTELKMTRRGWKCHKDKKRARKLEEKGKKKPKTKHGKHKQEEKGSFENRRRKIYASNYFLFTWKEKSQMKSASEDDKPFFGRANTDSRIYSRNETDRTHREKHLRPLPPSTFSYLHFIFLVVFFFIILCVVCSETSNVHKRPWAPHATSVHVPPNSSEVVMGEEEEEEEEEGPGNMLLGRWNRKKGKWKWRQLSFSGIMCLEADWCQSSWCHWGLLWFDPRSPPVVSAPAVPEDTDKRRLILWRGRISHTAL